MKRRRVWQRIVSLLLVFVMVFTVAEIQPDADAFAAAKTPLATHGRLAVKGADLVDAKGRKFQLRGVSTHGINWDVGYPYVNKAAFQTLRDDWGANAVRLAMYTSEYNGYCSGGNQAQLRNQIYKGVNMLQSLECMS